VPDNTPNSPPQAHCLGIVGGGQLGMLLCRAARKIGVQTAVLSPDAAAPAVHEADHLVTADYDDPAAIDELISLSDTITFEFEAVPDSALARLQEAVERREVRVHPEPATLGRLKDKGLQKQWLQRSGLPTLPFELTDSETSVEAILAGSIQLPLVQKARQGGYDGKGVQILRSLEELAGLWPVPGLVEPALDDCTEVAVVVVSNGRDKLLAYPPVSMTFDPELNAVSTVTSPAGVSRPVQADCEAVARDAVSLLGSAGVFAVELFVTPAGEVYINEVSPRVHNSGHLTLDAFKHCQFEQHVRAVTGLPLAPIVPRSPAAAMLNLLYDDSMAPALSPRPYDVTLDDKGYTRMHWYGKQTPRPGRKMGHITALGMSAEDALERVHAGLARLRDGNLPDDSNGSRALAS
jgi:5-(carboxyamino)imidazole ribonucleotide synthase